MAGAVGARPVAGLDPRAAGAWMRRERRVSGLRDADVAAAADITTWTLNAWENGRNTPSLGGFVGWARALGLDPGDALSRLVSEAS